MTSKLSPREEEVASLMAEGLRNREIAAQLGIGQATVKCHVSSILAKTGMRNRVAFVLARSRRSADE